MKGFWFLHNVLLIAISQGVKWHLIPINTFKVSFRQTCYAKIGEGNSSINDGDKFHLFIFTTLRYALDKLIIAKFWEITVITCDGYGSCTLHFF